MQRPERHPQMCCNEPVSPGKFSTSRLALLAAAFALAWWQWRSPALYPLVILCTLLHEFSHAAAGLLTGGTVVRIEVYPGGGGLCLVAGGWRWLTLAAGYPGSMAWGCAILLAACRTRYDRLVSMALGLVVAAGTLIYVRTSTGLLYGLGLGLALAWVGKRLSEEVNDLILTFLGSMVCLHAFFDLRYLLAGAGGQNTDAVMFSKEILPLPPAAWALLWTAAGLACLAGTLRIALRPPPGA